MTQDLETRIEQTTLLLAESCAEWGITLAGDRSVSESDAERLLGYGQGTLRKQREYEVCSIPRRRVGNRWRYRLHDLATVIEREYT